MLLDGGAGQALPWKIWYVFPVALYLLASLVRGLRFSILVTARNSSEVNAKEAFKLAMPFQQAVALNNVSVFYFTDLFLYWFYKPFSPDKKLIASISLARVSEFFILGAGFLWMGRGGAGAWHILFALLLAYSAIAFVIAWKFFKSSFKRLFLRVTCLSVLGWLLEIAALALLHLIHQGKGADLLVDGFKSILNSFLIGHQLMFHWLFTIHFILAFASLLLIKYKKD